METTADTVDPGRVTQRERLRRELAVVGVAGPLAGLVGGLLARIAMRGIAMSAGVPVGFSVGGTLNILAVGAILGIVVMLVYAPIRRFLPGPWFVPGLAIGAVPTAGFLLLTSGRPAEDDEPGAGAAVALFGGVATLGGLATAWIAARIRRRFEAGGWTQDGWPAVGVVIAAFALLLLGLIAGTSLIGAVAAAL